MKKLILSMLFLFTCASVFSQKKEVDLIIKSANIIDVKTGEIITGKAIAIKGGTIINVFNEKQISGYKSKQILDGKGKYLIPGLWDMHMHFGGGDSLINENKNLLPLFLAYGITTVRDAAADISPSVLQWRDQIAAGKLLGPRIFTSGPKLEGYKSVWKGDIEVGNTKEIELALDSLQKMHVDFVKITDNTLKPDLFLEAIRLARKRGYKVSAHIPSALTMEQIADAGLSSVEHLGYALKAGSKVEKEISDEVAAGTLRGKAFNQKVMQTFDETAALAAYRNMAKHGMYLTPTLSLNYILTYFEKDNHKNDSYLQYIGKGLQKTYEGRVKRVEQDDAEAIAFRHELFEKTVTTLPLLQKAGVKILAGTDAGYLNSYAYPGIGLHTELELLVKYGLTPLQALQASVVNSPEFLGKKEYGSIASGKKADILLLDENPLKNISATQKIFTVITAGKVLNRSTLNSMLEEVKNSQ
ncbi:amidohydrolase family protein [Pedobacter foliorum]|uniref:amidohydrolase family protein n=1 Tax=Pedobacter foliorum TaxID=2739058 RepID=UPI001565871C|nr:amidohydrolase family protein [Pedobacter foliorum]NRF38899.1 amidohydrolase family protein [Pedobacter foliorum]